MIPLIAVSERAFKYIGGVFMRWQNLSHQEQEENQIDMSYIEESEVNAYVAKVFGWMFLGLVVTALTTGALVYGIAVSDAIAEFVYSVMGMFFVLFIGQLILVHSLSRRVHSMNPTTAKVLYIIYAMSNAFTVGMVVVIYAAYILGPATVAMAFGITAASFGIMAIYGYTTKTDLTRFSSLFTMALIGLIIASIANWFLGNSMLDFLVCVVGLFIFLGLVAVDTHKIKNHYAQVAIRAYNEDGTVNYEQQTLASNLAIVGALMLYLDFINMLLFILRLLGRRR